MKKDLLKEVIKFVKSYSPTKSSTYAVALTKSGKLLTGVFFNSELDSARLCAEAGCMIEANKLKDPITHSLCIWYDSESDDYGVLPACGYCQERLATFGMGVMIAIPKGKTGKEYIFKSLKELRPYFWADYGSGVGA